MRTIFTIFLASFVLMMFTADAQTRDQKQERIQKLVDSRTFSFIAESATPMSGGNIRLTATNYHLNLNRDSLNSFLPYFGTAYRAEYVSSESPLSFISSDFTLSEKPTKRGGWILTIRLDQPDDPDMLILDISQSGYATLSVNSSDRQSIAFYGYIDSTGDPVSGEAL